MDDHSKTISEAWDFLKTRGDGRVKAVAQRAFHEPSLRDLLPFQSLNHLRFSVAIDYPYDNLPYISAEGPDNGRYEARDESNAVLASGDLDSVVAAVADAIRKLLKDRS
jgi:hypothetical protein